MEQYDPRQDLLYETGQLSDEQIRELEEENRRLQAAELLDVPEAVEESAAPAPQQTEQPQQQAAPEPEPTPERAQAVETSPFRNEDGTIDYEKIDRYGAESDKDFLVGIQDFGIDLVNLIPGVNIEKAPKFENEIAQFMREASSFLVPTGAATGLLTKGIKATRFGQTSKLATNPFGKKVAEWALDAGVGVGVDVINKYSSEGDNLAGSAKKLAETYFPAAAGLIPDQIATIDTDGPDDRHRKSILEGFGIGTGMYFLSGLGALSRGDTLRIEGEVPEPNFGRIVGDSEASEAAISSMRRTPDAKATREFYIESRMRNAEEYSAKSGRSIEDIRSDYEQGWESLTDEQKKAWSEIAAKNDPEFVMEDLAARQEEALDELGQYNLSRSANLDEPLLGVHDLYGYRESGVTTVDQMGIIDASVDLSRITRNIDSVDGSMGSVMSEPAIKYAISDDAPADVQEVILRGLTEQMKDVGEYSYISSTGQKITYAEIVDDGLTLAGQYMGESVDDLITMFRPFLQETDQYGIRQLDDPGYKAAMDSLANEMRNFVDPDYQRAQGYLAGSLSRQVSDLATGTRLMAGSEAVQRGQEQILDRIQYLMMLTGNTRLSRGRALQALDIAADARKANKAGRRYATLAEQQEMLNAGVSREMTKLKTDVNETINTLRYLSQSQPQFLDEFVLAYEVSGGRIDTVKKLNDIVAEGTKGILRKGLIDPKPELESMVMKNMWTGIYNSILSAAATVIKAGTGSITNLVALPATHFGGALLLRDKQTLRAGWAAYSGVFDTLQKGLQYASDVWKRSADDPYVLNPRDYMNVADDTGTMQIMRKRADRMAAEGEYGGQIFMNQLEDWQAFNESPWTRFGQRGMGVWDGFVQAVVANWDARARAWEELTDFGTRELGPGQLKQQADKIYESMFTKNGNVTDEAVKWRAGELNFNLDSPMSRALSNLARRYPVLKPFLLFQKTQVTSLGYTANHTPIGVFNSELIDFTMPFEEIPMSKAQEVLEKRGVYTDDANVIEAEYRKNRAITKGRAAAGSMFVAGAIGLFMNDRITGDGTTDPKLDRARTRFNRPKRSVKGLDGNWYSYDGLGALSAWMALTVNVMDNGLDGNWHAKARLRPDKLAEHFRALGFVISASLTDKSFTKALEPLNDMQSNPAAINRWLSSFAPAAAGVPNTSLIAEFSRLMYPSLRVVENELGPLIMNRTPLKGQLPEEHDPLHGGVINEPQNFWQRIANTYLPFKSRPVPSKEQNFLLDINYSMLPAINKRKYTAAQQSEINRIMGEEKIWLNGIKQVMQSRSGKDFRERYNRAVDAANTDPDIPMPDLQTLENLHNMIDAHLNMALRSAESKLKDSDEIQQRTYQETVIKNMRRGVGTEEQVQDFAGYQKSIQ